MNEWHDLFVATAGASAALTGLIFVGVSINLSRILSLPTLPARALISMLLLLSIMLVSIMMLTPNDDLTVYGIEILIFGLILWFVVLYLDIRILRKKEKPYRNLYSANFMTNQLAIVPYMIAGIMLMKGNIAGLYWLEVSVVLSFIKASSDAWVLLVEINR